MLKEITRELKFYTRKYLFNKKEDSSKRRAEIRHTIYRKERASWQRQILSFP